MGFLEELWKVWQQDDEWWPLNALLLSFALPVVLLTLMVTSIVVHVVFERISQQTW